MNINFNITDELGEKFISASRWMIDGNELSDDRIIKKNIKKYIGNCIDGYNKSLLLGDSASLVSNLTSKAEDFRNRCFIANEEYAKARSVVEATYTNIDVGSD
jgi:hypothetical protein